MTKGRARVSSREEFPSNAAHRPSEATTDSEVIKIAAKAKMTRVTIGEICDPEVAPEDCRVGVVGKVRAKYLHNKDRKSVCYYNGYRVDRRGGT